MTFLKIASWFANWYRTLLMLTEEREAAELRNLREYIRAVRDVIAEMKRHGLPKSEIQEATRELRLQVMQARQRMLELRAPNVREVTIVIDNKPAPSGTKT